MCLLQTKTLTKCHFTPTVEAVIKKIKTSVGEDVEKLVSLYTAGRDYKIGQLLWKMVW